MAKKDTASKRRAEEIARPNYTGALAQPIYWEDYYKVRGLGQAIQEPDIAAINKRAVEKLWLLFEHYKIDPSDEQSWQELAMSLALAHVPGLRLANRPKPGRKPTWKAEPVDEWVRAIDDVKSRTGKSTKEAIAELLEEPKWRTFTSQRNISLQSLEARYWEVRRRQKALASLREAWLNELKVALSLAAPCATAPPLGWLQEDEWPADEN
jgi:hypothetical protein